MEVLRNCFGGTGNLPTTLAEAEAKAEVVPPASALDAHRLDITASARWGRTGDSPTSLLAEYSPPRRRSRLERIVTTEQALPAPSHNRPAWSTKSAETPVGGRPLRSKRSRWPARQRKIPVRDPTQTLPGRSSERIVIIQPFFDSEIFEGCPVATSKSDLCPAATAQNGQTAFFVAPPFGLGWPSTYRETNESS